MLRQRASYESVRRIILTAFFVMTLAAACPAHRPRGATARAGSEDAAGFRCPSGEAEPARPPTRMSLGDVTKKARALPRPEYPREAKRAGVSGVVRAEVVIDLNSGKIEWAKVGRGHTLLRRAVKDVVCGAQFYPTNITGRPIKVLGTITYRFRGPRAAR